MVPRQNGLGRSFMGAGDYYLHDKQADTSERVAFTHAENIPTQNPEKALKWMAWTAIHAEDLKRESGTEQTGHSSKKPVFTFSLSWHPEQEPHKEDMVGAGRRALVALGLEEHETLMVAHSDRDHPHLHLIVNTVHPETGSVNRLSYSQLRLSKWAEAYEREHGKIYCEQRVENNARRDQGRKVNVHADLIAEIYNSSDNGKAFQAALAERGFKLAQGKGSRILVIDPEGVPFNLARRIEGLKSKEIKAKLKDLDGQLQPLSEFADELESKRKEERPKTSEETELTARNKKADEPVYCDRDQQDREWQESIVDAGIKGSDPAKRKDEADQRSKTLSPEALNALQDRHLSELGRFYEENNQAKLRLAAQLDESYGVHEEALRGQAARLEEVTKNSGAFRLWWLKATRQIPRNPEQEIQNARLSLENIESRRNEAYQSLESEISERRQAIESRHAREQLEFQEPAQPPPAQDQVPPAQEVDHTPGPDEDTGPSLSY